MKFRVSHLTRYEYPQNVSFSPHTLYLRPRETPFLRVTRFRFNITPNARITEARDAYDNAVTYAYFWDRASALNIRTEFEIETSENNPFDFLVRQDAVNFPFTYSPFERYVLSPYLAAPSPQAQIAIHHWWNASNSRRSTETVPLLAALNQELYRNLRYRHREPGSLQDAQTTLSLGEGACRDFAITLVEICRTIGVAARFVSGYLYSHIEDDHIEPNAMHAWAEVYLPGAGWKGIDPSHGVFCTNQYVPVAHGPVAECVSAVQGSYYSSVRVPSQLTTNVLVEKVDA